MNTATVLESIDVADLQVGMFVHLDLSWLAHPFPLSSFRIASVQQIDTIRSLGVRRVRWNRGQSELPVVAVLDPAASTAAAATVPAAPPTAVQSPEELARAAHRRLLAQQRAGLKLCERQFAQAVAEGRRATELVASKPLEAAAHATALTQALVDKMLGEHELCIRLLGEIAGDKASTHALNVTIIALLMGRSFGFVATDLLDLGVGSLMHDIGKLDLPERMRHREDHFSAAELRCYEEHVAHGVAYARRMGLSAGATLVIAQHHEHADASGFPLKITTDRMTPLSRIVALVNRYDNLCNPYLLAHAMTPHEALSLLFAHARTQFDTAILGAFIKMMGVYPPGSLVQLTDDRYALVVAVNSSRPLKPRVMVHDVGVPAEEALVLDLETTSGLGIRRSVRSSALPDAARQYLGLRPRVAYFFEPASPQERDS
jgi:putative nucleotidyltransferase with HDIG domain